MTGPRRELPLVSLAALMYFMVCGGTYGIEEAVHQAGAWWTLALVVALPFLWGVPISLMVAELATLMPREGGYYAWVDAELGPFWATQVGWWALCMSAVDMALYPALFAGYLAYFVPTGPAAKWIVGIALIALALGLNLRGVRTVGRNALLGTLVVLAPLFVASVLVLGTHGATLGAAREAPGAPGFAAFGTGLSIVMWNYMGWDNASTIAGEVREPQRSYPRALALVVLLTVATYLLPLAAGLALYPDPAAWSEWTVWPRLGAQAGGAALGIAVALAALVAQWSLFNSSLLYASRIPFAMALRGALPQAFSRTNASAAPAAALCALAILAAVLTAWSFEKLVVIDVLLYSAVLSLQFAVLVVLRRRDPARARPFRIPGGWPGVIAVTAAPAMCAGLLVWLTLTAADEGGAIQLGTVACVVASGVALYAVRRRKIGTVPI